MAFNCNERVLYAFIGGLLIGVAFGAVFGILITAFRKGLL